MKRRAALVFLLVLCGCSMVSGTRRPDGTLTVTSWRALWKSESIAFSVTDSNLTATLTVGKSTTDAQALAAVADAAVKAAIKSTVPIP